MATRTGAGTRAAAVKAYKTDAQPRNNVLSDLAGPAKPLVSSIKPVTANPKPKGMFAKSHRPGFDATE